MVAACDTGSCLDSCISIEDSDFSVSFDGMKWTVAWKWKSSEEPVLSNQCTEYAVNECKPTYNQEIELWVRDG